MSDELVAPPSRQVRRAKARADRKPNGGAGTPVMPELGIEPDAPGEARLTDAGAAEGFAHEFGDDWRFDYRRAHWKEWSGHCWRPDTDGAITRVAIKFARRLQRSALDIADRDRRERVLTFAMRLERRDGMSNMLSIARALPPIAYGGGDWDADGWLLGVPNGTADLRTGELRPGRRADLITKQAAVPFDPDAACPRWERFIAEVFGGDVALAAFVQRAIGYTLTGDTSAQCLFLCHGTGANGKTTLLNALKRVLGDYGWNMPFATIETRDRAAIPNDVAALVGRRFVVASETNDGTRLNEARVKALTGCDPITARFLHQEFFTFEPVAKFWLAVNHKPVVKDDSHGFWRRLRLIPFAQTFGVDEGLGPALAAEAPGILAWAVRGCLAWQREGLDPPAVVLDATAAYQQESDSVGDFLAECVEADEGSELTAADFYGAYADWAKARGLSDHRGERLSSSAFGRRMSERFPTRRVNGSRRYLGICRRLP